MTDITVDRIMRNIYGTSATGQITNLSGGNMIPTLLPKNCMIEERPLPRVQYIDVKDMNNNLSLNMFGGGKKTKRTKSRKNKASSSQPKNDNIIIYASPEYIPDNSDLHTFIDKFFLYYRVSRSPNSSIYIIPPTNELKDMVKKRGDFPEGSLEMQNAVRKNENIGYERYIFVTFGNNSKSNNYRIDPGLTTPSAYPNSAFEMVRRTNLKGEVFYISCNSDKKVKIHTSPKNSNDGNELKFVGRFNNGGYVFQGKIPSTPIEKIAPKKQSYKRKTINKFKFGEMPYTRTVMTGGANNSSLKLLEKYDNVYNGDHDMAAEHFLRCAAKAGKLSDKYRNNGDLLYSSLYFALSEPTAVSEENFGQEDDRDLFSDYKPRQRGSEFKHKVDDALNTLNNIYKKAEKTCSYNNFVESYKHLYSSNDICKSTADIMTGHIRNNDGLMDAKLIDNIYNSFNDTNNVSSSMAALIKHAYNNNPLPSAFGSEYYPITSMNSFESDMKKNKYKGKKDDNSNQDESFETKDLANEIFSSKPKVKEAEKIIVKDPENIVEDENSETLDNELDMVDDSDDALNEQEIDMNSGSDDDNLANFY